MIALLVAIWFAGWLLLVAGALQHNAEALHPDELWPPGCVFLFALWPLLFLLASLPTAKK